MSDERNFLYTYLIIYLPLFTFVATLFILTSLGISIGIRKYYIKTLIFIFEFGRRKIERAEKKQKKDNNDDESECEVTIFKEEVSDNGRSRKEFCLLDACDLMTSGINAIVDDEVTKRFSAEDLQSWNLLTRTNKNYCHISLRLTVLWGIGFIIRYGILLPSRLVITIFGITWLAICTAAIGCLREGSTKRWIYCNLSLMCFRILSRGFSGIITYHSKENKPKTGGICVANHTSPIDVVVLAFDNCYALVGQRQGGLLGLIQRALARAATHLWFERFEIKDRELVTKRLQEHVDHPEKLPILIFPEGTCINNSAVMMFKKGSFEVGGVVYPVAIKYDPRFGDPFWNSSRHGYIYYLLLMMTSWAIVCDVWYLPPMTREKSETSVDFANRVKAAIARRGGLVDLSWDGQLKRTQVKAEWKEKQQEEFSKRIKLD